MDIFSQFFGNNGQGQQQQNNNNQQQQQQSGQGMFNNFMQNFNHFPDIFGQPQFNPMAGFQNQNRQQNQQSYQFSNNNGNNSNNNNFFQQQQSNNNGQQQFNNNGQQQQNNSNNNSQHQRFPSFRNTRSNFNKKEDKNKKKSTQKKEQLHDGMALYWKEKGNESFKNKYYDLAIEQYTKAIELDGSQSIFYANRGKCWKLKGNYEKALKDAQEAMELDEKSVKAHLLCGQCLAQISKGLKGKECENKLANAVKKMTKALTLCPNFGGDKAKQYERELSIYILRAKKLLWYKNYEEMKEKKMQILHNYSDYLEKTVQDQEEKAQKYQEFINMIGDPTKHLNMVIPDHLICKITFDMMEDPVTNSAGQTYEREIIEEHIKKNGLIDPLTREPLKNELYSNIAVKQGIDEFLSVNPWAFEFSEDQQYEDIQF